VNKTEEIFGLARARPEERRRPASTKRIDMIGVPFIPFCE
jgi:hypothetical protein